VGQWCLRQKDQGERSWDREAMLSPALPEPGMGAPRWTFRNAGCSHGTYENLTLLAWNCLQEHLAGWLAAGELQGWLESAGQQPQGQMMAVKTREAQI
jgi:hypothetical protein